VPPSAYPGGATLPRDNPVKDFLASANAKFAAFRQADPAFVGVLFIVWDDYVNEPIGALLNPASGLLTPNSFDRDENGEPRAYQSVDAVVVLRHQVQLQEGMANRLPLDERWHFLDFGAADRFPFNALVVNPHCRNRLPTRFKRSPRTGSSRSTCPPTSSCGLARARARTSKPAAARAALVTRRSAVSGRSGTYLASSSRGAATARAYWPTPGSGVPGALSAGA